ncbi:MAG: hypothetical protein RMJ56_16750 [Gemmataceae bacterium]|nr:hypothetical protein [Gemmata sp.]MDW8199248.1 hypothetical protein [Gemmataceae bacterium]
MPRRMVVALIVAFWLTTTGFVFYRDVWPRLVASGPPPVAIDLADEARQNSPTKWTIHRNGAKSGQLTTQMKYLDADDAFQFSYRYTHLELEQAGIVLKIPEASLDVFMTRHGDLKEQHLGGQIELLMKGSSHPFASGTMDVRGVVRAGILTGRCSIRSSLVHLEGDLEPVPVPQGQPLNPLQPVNRLANVRGGQTWVVHELNPLQDAIGGLVRQKVAELGLRLPELPPRERLVAEVAPSPQTLRWHNEDVPCWVIEYRRQDVVARTWVRQTDGQVLRQEAFEKGEKLSFERQE